MKNYILNTFIGLILYHSMISFASDSNTGDINSVIDCYGSTQLMLAVTENNIEKVKKLLDLGADVNKSKYFGDTPLHLAAEEGLFDVVKILISYGANVNSTNIHLDTPFRKSYKKIREDESDGVFPPKYKKVSDNHREISKLLLANGAKNEWRPLWVPEEFHFLYQYYNLEYQLKQKNILLPYMKIKEIKSAIINTNFVFKYSHKISFEIWLIIISNISDFKDLNNLRCTSKYLHQIMNNSEDFQSAVNRSICIWDDMDKLQKELENQLIKQENEFNEDIEPQTNQSWFSIGRCIIN